MFLCDWFDQECETADFSNPNNLPFVNWWSLSHLPSPPQFAMHPDRAYWSQLFLNNPLTTNNRCCFLSMIPVIGPPSQGEQGHISDNPDDNKTPGNQAGSSTHYWITIRPIAIRAKAGIWRNVYLNTSRAVQSCFWWVNTTVRERVKSLAIPRILSSTCRHPL